MVEPSEKVTDNGTPESVGDWNAGKSFIDIMGIKGIEDLQKMGEFTGREEYQGFLWISCRCIVFLCS